MQLLARIAGASNLSFLGTHDGYAVIYKPEQGMRPLHDFEAATLPGRELAAWQVSDAAGFDCVPHTEYVDGEHGPGSAQRWCGATGEYVTSEALLAALEEPATAEDDMFPEPGAGLFEVTESEEGLVIAHDMSSDLRRLALFDIVTNNTDRKIGHILRGPGGSIVGIDNGLTFHEDCKLRTVLWGFAGEPLDDAEVSLVQQARDILTASTFQGAATGVSAREFDAAALRCDALRETPVFPRPYGDHRDYPWPPW